MAPNKNLNSTFCQTHPQRADSDAPSSKIISRSILKFETLSPSFWHFSYFLIFYTKKKHFPNNCCGIAHNFWFRVRKKLSNGTVLLSETIATRINAQIMKWYLSFTFRICFFKRIPFFSLIIHETFLIIFFYKTI